MLRTPHFLVVWQQYASVEEHYEHIFKKLTIEIKEILQLGFHDA